MQEWNLKVKSNVQEIIKKLEATLGYVDGFVFNIDNDKNDSVTFKVRKRGLYAFQIILLNRIIVNGKILKTDTENETDVEISFTQDVLTKLIMFINIFFGLGLSLTALISGINSNSYMLIAGGILITIGIALWFDVQQRFERNIQKYKTLISEILEL
jgi:hypothetical protein